MSNEVGGTYYGSLKSLVGKLVRRMEEESIKKEIKEPLRKSWREGWELSFRKALTGRWSFEHLSHSNQISKSFEVCLPLGFVA